MRVSYLPCVLVLHEGTLRKGLNASRSFGGWPQETSVREWVWDWRGRLWRRLSELGPAVAPGAAALGDRREFAQRSPSWMENLSLAGWGELPLGHYLSEPGLQGGAQELLQPEKCPGKSGRVCGSRLWGGEVLCLHNPWFCMCFVSTCHVSGTVVAAGDLAVK